MAAKQHTANVFAAAVCKAGWRLNSAAAAAVGRSRLNQLAPPSDTNMRSILWGLAATLVEECSAVQETYSPAMAYSHALTCKVAAMRSGQSASDSLQISDAALDLLVCMAW